MALLKESDLNPFSGIKTVATFESRKNIDLESFDIFLSHSLKDESLIIKLKRYLERKSLKVYVDWIDDNQLNRNSVNEETADILRKRMKQSRCLFFATSVNSTDSKWMPWECGYFDGLKNKVAILPIVKSDQDEFRGQEYLKLYPYVDFTDSIIWINGSGHRYCKFEEWLDGKSP